MEKNKKIIIGGVILLAIIILITIILISNKNKQETSNKQPLETLEISQVFDIEDITKSKYEIEKTENKQIASKYSVGNNIYKLNAKVKFVETIGEMKYLRETNNNLNIFQTEYKIDEYENISSQVEGIIENFERMCISQIGINIEETKPTREDLYGEDTTEAPIPLGESIYLEKRLYSKVYETEDAKYDINFYRTDNKITCEFVKYE